MAHFDGEVVVKEMPGKIEDAIAVIGKAQGAIDLIREICNDTGAETQKRDGEAAISALEGCITFLKTLVGEEGDTFSECASAYGAIKYAKTVLAATGGDM